MKYHINYNHIGGNQINPELEKFKNIHKGETAVIIAGGPTTDEYLKNPIRNAKNFTCNGSGLLKDIKQDYYFCLDKGIHHENSEFGSSFKNEYIYEGSNRDFTVNKFKVNDTDFDKPWLQLAIDNVLNDKGVIFLGFASHAITNWAPKEAWEKYKDNKNVYKFYTQDAWIDSSCSTWKLNKDITYGTGCISGSVIYILAQYALYMGFSKIVIVGADGYSANYTKRDDYFNNRYTNGWEYVSELLLEYKNVKLYHLNKKNIFIKNSIEINNVLEI